MNRLVIMFAALLFVVFETTARASEPGACSVVYGDYARAVRNGPSSTDEFRRRWIARFDWALAAPRSEGDLDARLVVLGERGALLRGIGRPALARESFEQLASEAEHAGRHALRVDAVETELAIAQSSGDLVGGIELAAELDSAVSDHVAALEASTTSRPADWARISDTLIALSQANLRSAAALEAEDTRDGAAVAALLQKAEAAATRAVSLGEVGANTMSHKLFQLAQARTQLGDAPGASEAYAELLARDDGIYSRMWISDLEIQTRHSPDSAEYRSEVEKILESLGDDEHEISLRQALASSYLESGDFTEAIAALSGAMGKGASAGVQSTNMWLLAQATLAGGDPIAAQGILSDLIVAYPGTVSAVQAAKDLESIAARDSSDTPREATAAAAAIEPEPQADAAPTPARAAESRMPVIAALAAATVLVLVVFVVRARKRAHQTPRS